MSRRIVLSYKDRFVIFHYLYSRKVQPLEAMWAATQSELVRSNPRVMKAGVAPGVREDKEGECFVRFGHGGGLTPSGVTIKVRTYKEGKSFGFGSHWPWDRRAGLVGKVYPSAQSLNLFE
jgi:hypothetical protein